MNNRNSATQILYGLDGIREVFSDILETKKELVGWGATDRARCLLPEYTDQYIHLREQRNIRARQLAVEGSQVLQTPYSKFKFIPKEYSSPATTLIFGNTVAIMMWFSEPIISIRIVNAHIAEAYRNHFEFLWGTKLFNAEEILASRLVQNEIKKIFGDQATAVIKRRTSWIIRLAHESHGLVKRIIILPPGGRTSGEYSGILKDHELLSPHPEALKAKITIRGGVAPGRNGFRKIDRGITFSYLTKRSWRFGIDIPNEEYKSSHTPPFTAVKQDGYGFWHNVTNVSNEWVMLVLEKEMIPSKPLILKKVLERFPKHKVHLFEELARSIKEKGDHVFEINHNPLEPFVGVEPEVIAQALIALLNLPDTGNHEQCTAVALLLKLGKTEKSEVIRSCRVALRQNQAPVFYLEEIIRKLGN